MDTRISPEQCQIEVWNRRYHYESEIFPSEILIAGKNILYRPITLNTVFDNGPGVWTKRRYIPFSHAVGKSVFCAAMEAENLILNADIEVEEDGLIKTNFRLIPYWSFSEDNRPRLKEVSLNIAIKKEYATLLHFWPNCDSSICLDSRVLNSMELPRDGVTLPFKPYVWLGWEEGGLGICCEDNRSFRNQNVDEVYRIRDCGEYVSLHIALLDDIPEDWKSRADGWGDNLDPILFSFGLQATPVKEFDQRNLTDWRVFHQGAVMKSPIFQPGTGNGDSMLEKIAAKGVKWLILHEDWTLLQNYGMPPDPQDFKRFARDCHALGIKLMVYFGYEVSSLLPGFNHLSGSLLNRNQNGHFVGGWQREPMQRDYTVCYSGDYSSIMLERVRYVMDELGVDGIYTDGTYVPWECCNEAHGCGWRGADGELHCTYPIYAVREHVRKLYQTVHERGGVIDTHQSSCCLMATLGYVDSYYDGENIQDMLAEDLTNLKLDAFRAEFTGVNMGIPCNFISYTRNGYTMRMIAGITLIHNVLPRAGKLEDLDFISRIWQIYDTYGIETADWIPYWADGSLRPENPNIYISRYHRDGDDLLFILCLDKAVDSIRLASDFDSIEDLLDQDAACRIQSGEAVIPMRYVEIKICRLRKKSRS